MLRTFNILWNECVYIINSHKFEFPTDILTQIQSMLGEIEIPGQHIFQFDGIFFKDPFIERSVLVFSIDNHIHYKIRNRRVIQDIVFNGTNCKK